MLEPFWGPKTTPKWGRCGRPFLPLFLQSALGCSWSCFGHLRGVFWEPPRVPSEPPGAPWQSPWSLPELARSFHESLRNLFWNRLEPPGSLLDRLGSFLAFSKTFRAPSEPPGASWFIGILLETFRTLWSVLVAA
jgi:hypothetical protein